MKINENNYALNEDMNKHIDIYWQVILVECMATLGQTEINGYEKETDIHK